MKEGNKLRIFVTIFVVCVFVGPAVMALFAGASMAYGYRDSSIMTFVLILGIGLGLFGAYTFQKETINISFQNKKDFIDKLIIGMEGIGYRPQSQTETLIMFKRKTPDIIPLGISVQIENDKVIIKGPKLNLKKLQRRLAV